MKKKNEAFLVKTLLVFLGWMPRFLAVFVGKLLATGWYLLDGKHRRKILADINRTSLAKRSEEEKVAIVKGVYLHFGIMTAELSRFRKWNEDKIRSAIDFSEGEKLLADVKQGNGILFIGAHLGNWELTGMAAPLFGIPLCAVARPLKNEQLDKYLVDVRTRFGQEILTKFNVMLEIVRKLKAGKTVGLLIDQDAEKDCEFVPFMGEIAGTLRVPAKLAVKYKLPVYSVSSYRIKPFKHKYRIIGPIEYPAEGENAVAQTTRIFNDVLSGLIEENPSQWMWFHHRWRTADKRGLTKKSKKDPKG